MTRGWAPGLLLLLASPAVAAPARTAIGEAERLAREAVQLVSADPAAARERARRALALTAEFQPTLFVAAGRKGEVVEDAFVAARRAYQRHRAGLYEALGTVLAAQGEALAASRYLARALRLDPTPARAFSLAREQVALGRGQDALETIWGTAPEALTPESLGLLSRAADVAGLPSLQVEIDRFRLAHALAGRVALREGPLETPVGARLSTAPLVRLEDAPLTLVYAAEASCRSCSTDLDELSRHVPKDVRFLALPPGEDQDDILRRVIALYRRPWPLLVGRGVAARLGLEPRSLLVVARSGWTLAVLKAPFGPELASALAILQKSDLQETIPRPTWNRRPVDRSPRPAAPGLLPDGIAPGEDEPFPPEFDTFVAAFRAGERPRALEVLQALEAKGDGWLLSPEARLDRALCLATMGRRDEARRLLLRTGDSRFEEGVDRLLETVAAER